MSEKRLKIKEGELYFAYNPNYRRQMTYIRRGNWLHSITGDHKIEYNFKEAKEEEITALRETIKALEKIIIKKEKQIKGELKNGK